MKNVYFIALVVTIVLVSGGAIWYITQHDNLVPESMTQGLPGQVVKKVKDTMPSSRFAESTDSAQEKAFTQDSDEVTTGAEAAQSVAEGTEEIELVSVGTVSGSGQADRLIESGRSRISLEVKLPVAPQGKFYEAWLVGDPAVAGTFSIGRMLPTEGVEGVFTINYESTADLRAFGKVQVTEESLANKLDGKQETVLLEGSFD